MGLREELAKRIERKSNEVNELENSLAELAARIREANSYIQALEDTLKLLPKDSDSDLVSTVTIRAGSKVGKALDFLRRTGKPQHVLEIVKAIGDEPTASNRASLGSSIAAYVRKNEIFTRPAPNTYGLLEFGSKAATSNVPPSGFGRDHEEGEDITDLFVDVNA